jgi:hypothetical protein
MYPPMLSLRSILKIKLYLKIFQNKIFPDFFRCKSYLKFVSLCTHRS